MKTLTRYSIIILLAAILLPNLSYSANIKKFYGTHEVVITGNCAEAYYLTIGEDSSRESEDGYLYIYSNDVKIKGRTITYSWSSPGDAGSLKYAFSKNYKKGTVKGEITDGTCTGTITGGFKNVFAGTYKITTQCDSNIVSKDGMSLFPEKWTFKIAQNDEAKLTASVGKHSVQLVIQSENMATLPTHPYDMGTHNLLEFLLLSDGNNMVLTGIGQEYDDLADISPCVANWLRTPKTVTADDFVGTWNVNLYSDPNISNTGDGFDSASEIITISKVDSNTIAVTVGGDSLLLNVKKGRATLINAPVTGSSANYHAFSIVTDGTGLSLYLVATELYDPTDVSVTVGLGTKL